jgi:alpha-1,2-mannosyltransferase
MGFLLSVVSILISTIVAFVFLPQTLRILGKPVGLYLQQSCSDRRELLLARVAKEQKEYEAKHKNKKSEDEWEQIESSMTGSAVNGAKADQDWRGIVGFLHPFW